jgi:hypothetical protein
MGKFFLRVAFILLLALPAVAVGQNGMIRSLNFSLSSGNNFNNDELDEVLTLAAPEFGFSAEDFIRMYYTCGCITVQNIGPGVYLVTYGGIGIQIVIDGSRMSEEGDGPVATFGSRKR